MDWRKKTLRIIEARGWSRAELARRAGLDPKSLGNRFISGDSVEIGVDTATKLAQAMGVSMDWLFSEANDWPPPIVLSNEFPEDFYERKAIVYLALQELLQEAHHALQKKNSQNNKQAKSAKRVPGDPHRGR